VPCVKTRYKNDKNLILRGQNEYIFVSGTKIQIQPHCKNEKHILPKKKLSSHHTLHI
jgi:hypothetical protein